MDTFYTIEGFTYHKGQPFSDVTLKIAGEVHKPSSQAHEGEGLWQSTNQVESTFLILALFRMRF